MGKIPTCLLQGMSILNSLYLIAKIFSWSRLFGHFACDFSEFDIAIANLKWQRSFHGFWKTSSKTVVFFSLRPIGALNHGLPKKDIYLNFFWGYRLKLWLRWGFDHFRLPQVPEKKTNLIVKKRKCHFFNFSLC